MKYAIDRIENNFAVLENLETKEIVLEKLDTLPKIKEGSILVYKDGKYLLDNIEEKTRIAMIKEKMQKLKNND